MIDSIENDEKFRKLFNRYVSEYTQVLFESSYLNNKRTADLSSIEFELSHELVIEKLKDKSINTLKHIFKYIDRRVERAVLEERAKQPISVNKIKSDELMSFKASGFVWGSLQNEMLRLDCNGNCVFNFKELPLHLFDDLNGLLIQEIIKIDPALLMIKDHSLGFEGLFHESVLDFKERTIVVFFRFDGMRLELRFQSNNGLIEISLPEIAKYFSDEVNKIARDKYAPK